MSKTKEIQCKYYICEGKCFLGKEANFYGICQKCKKYVALKGTKPNRKNNKHKRLEEIRTRELEEGYF